MSFQSNISSESLERVFGPPKTSVQHVESQERHVASSILKVVIFGIAILLGVWIVYWLINQWRKTNVSAVKTTTVSTPVVTQYVSTPVATTPVMSVGNSNAFVSNQGSTNGNQAWVQPHYVSKEYTSDKEFYGYANLGGRKIAMDYPYSIDNGRLPSQFIDQDLDKNEALKQWACNDPRMQLAWQQSEMLAHVHPYDKTISVSPYY